VSTLSEIDTLLQQLSHGLLEGHMIAHDATVTSTELYAHLQVLRRKAVLDSMTPQLSAKDKARLVVLPLGGDDLFGPQASNIRDWRRYPEVESALKIATAI